MTEKHERTLLMTTAVKMAALERDEETSPPKGREMGGFCIAGNHAACGGLVPQVDGTSVPCDCSCHTAKTEVTQSWRHRIKVSQTSKGLLSFECSTEGTGHDRDTVLAESDAMVRELLVRYPAQKEG